MQQKKRDYKKPDSRRNDGRRNDNRRFDDRKSEGRRSDRRNSVVRYEERRYEERSYDNYGDNFGQEVNKNILIGRNPVMEALKAERDIDKLLVGKGLEGSIVKIIGMAKDKGIPIIYSDKPALDRVAGNGNHQGVIAYVSSYEYKELEDILALAKERNEDPFVIILDGLEDPHNLGAIMRTAECAGAHGILIPKRRNVGLTETVAKASAGAIEYVPVVRVTNIARSIEQLKEEGLWIAACDMGGQNYYEANLTGGLGIVIGSEGFGISRLVKEKCDFTVSMPMVGKITSLNASNAAAVLMYEVRKQRNLAL